MSDETTKSVKLRGGPDKSATHVGIKADGRLVVDWFDYSEDAHDFFGNDVAYLLFVAVADKPALLAALRQGSASPPDGNAEAEDDALLRLIQGRFESYFDIQEWFTANAVPFTKQFDAWA